MSITNLRYGFVEFVSNEDAAKAVLQLENWFLDKSHQLRATVYSEYYKLLRASEDWTEPVFKPYKSKVVVSFLTFQDFSLPGDPHDGQQFLAQDSESTCIGFHFPDTGIYHNDWIIDRKDWSNREMEWSTLGTFVASFHPKGVRLWIGKSFEGYTQFRADDANSCEFSCRERFVCVGCKAPNNSVRRIFGVSDGNELLQVGGSDRVMWSFDDRYMLQHGKVS